MNFFVWRKTIYQYHLDNFLLHSVREASDALKKKFTFFTPEDQYIIVVVAEKYVTIRINLSCLVVPYCEQPKINRWSITSDYHRVRWRTISLLHSVHSVYLISIPNYVVFREETGSEEETPLEASNCTLNDKFKFSDKRCVASLLKVLFGAFYSSCINIIFMVTLTGLFPYIWIFGVWPLQLHKILLRTILSHFYFIRNGSSPCN